jgi:2-polyprenyl-3-methyl-5-hydroxy-6-metoxy-1,4-benzoquinol methylase
MAPLPTPAQLAPYYPDQYYGSDGEKFRGLIETAIRFVGARRLWFLTSRLPQNASVLDIGCGRGVLLRELANCGYRVYGTERSSAAASGADSRAEIHIVETLSDARFEAEMFDMIILWHVFEHLVDPCETLKEASRILKAGGSLVIAVPNFSSWQACWSRSDWFHLDPPRHIFHFSIESLRRLLRSAGFEIRSWHHFSLRQNPFGWVQSVLNRIGCSRNSMYSWLLRDKTTSRELPSAGLQTLFIFAFLVGMPVAIAIEILAALFRRGATVHVVAVKPGRRAT